MNSEMGYFQTEFPNGKCAFNLLVFYSLLAWIAFDPIFREKVVEIEQAHPRGNFYSGFLLYYSCRPTGFSE